VTEGNEVRRKVESLRKVTEGNEVRRKVTRCAWRAGETHDRSSLQFRVADSRQWWGNGTQSGWWGMGQRASPDSPELQVVCVCGAQVEKLKLARHQQSPRHKDYVFVRKLTAKALAAGAEASRAGGSEGSTHHEPPRRIGPDGLGDRFKCTDTQGSALPTGEGAPSSNATGGNATKVTRMGGQVAGARRDSLGMIDLTARANETAVFSRPAACAVWKEEFALVCRQLKGAGIIGR
jgi:hypothetical protein